jgi:hypothetical protein
MKQTLSRRSRVLRFTIIFICCFGISACGFRATHGQDLISIGSDAENAAPSPGSARSDSGSADADTASPGKSSAHSDSSSEPVLDLTAMDADMVYATVYQMITSPDTYIGRTVRMQGSYDCQYYEPTGRDIHCCIIRDALGCCSNGMEFTLNNSGGSSAYPEEDKVITVEGRFETYRDDGDPTLYCQIADASIEA